MAQMFRRDQPSSITSRSTARQQKRVSAWLLACAASTLLLALVLSASLSAHAQNRAISYEVSHVTTFDGRSQGRTFSGAWMYIKNAAVGAQSLAGPQVAGRYSFEFSGDYDQASFQSIGLSTARTVKNIPANLASRIEPTLGNRFFIDKWSISNGRFGRLLRAMSDDDRLIVFSICTMLSREEFGAEAIKRAVELRWYDDVYKKFWTASRRIEEMRHLGRSCIAEIRKVFNPATITLPIEAARMKRIQSALERLGFYTRGIDGLFGPGTRQAVAAYRRSFDFPGGDGLSDAELSTLERIARSGFRDGNELRRADAAGFKQRDEWELFVASGSSDPALYREALSAGFTDTQSFEQARDKAKRQVAIKAAIIEAGDRRAQTEILREAERQAESEREKAALARRKAAIEDAIAKARERRMAEPDEQTRHVLAQNTRGTAGNLTEEALNAYSAENLTEEALNAYAAGDHEAAFALFRAAADRGHLEAMAYIGDMYAVGHGVPENKSRAENWWRKAEALGETMSSLSSYQRAMLYEEDPDNPAAELRAAAGSAVWRLDAEDPDDPGIVAQVRVPDMGITMTMTIRRNLDADLPASHTIELDFVNAGDPNRDVLDAGLPHLKEDEIARGAPLAGLTVPISDNFFLIGLSNLQVDQQRNRNLLINRNWIELPMRFAGGQRAVIAFDKGVNGQHVFEKAFAAWTDASLEKAERRRIQDDIRRLLDQERERAAWRGLFDDNDEGTNRDPPLMLPPPGFASPTEPKMDFEAPPEGSSAVAELSEPRRVRTVTVTVRSDGTITRNSDSASIEPNLASAGSFSPLPRPDALAVVIGNRNYQEAPEVRFAHNDATAFATYFTDVMGLEEHKVLLEEDLTSVGMSRLFGRPGGPDGRLHNLARFVDEVFVFYSGHGVPEIRLGEAARGYLLPVDVPPEAPGFGAYALDDLIAQLQSLPVSRVTLFIDACFSGLSESGSLVPDVSGAFGVSVAPPPREANVSVLAATAFDQPQLARWLPDREHGAFTYLALDGLHGAADRDGDRRVTLTELQRFIDERLAFKGFDQSPSLVSGGDDDLIMDFSEAQELPVFER